MYLSNYGISFIKSTRKGYEQLAASHRIRYRDLYHAQYCTVKFHSKAIVGIQLYASSQKMKICIFSGFGSDYSNIEYYFDSYKEITFETDITDFIYKSVANFVSNEMINLNDIDLKSFKKEWKNLMEISSNVYK